jgi:hypothetical protein
MTTINSRLISGSVGQFTGAFIAKIQALISFLLLP